jgi:hypothetical protein
MNSHLGITKAIVIQYINGEWEKRRKSRRDEARVVHRRGPFIPD